MKKLLRKLEVMVLLFAVCFVGSMYVSKNMCCDVINRDIECMMNNIYNGMIEEIEQFLFLIQ